MLTRLVIAMFLACGIAYASGGACPASLPVSGNNCYFVSAAGLDSNNGTTESTPWLHAPGMPNCSSACLTKQTAGMNPGEGVILRGGDTWHLGNSGASPYTGGTWDTSNWIGTGTTCQYEGTTSGCIYWGVDKTWFTGGSWVRPILTGDNALLATPGVGQFVASCSHSIVSTNEMMVGSQYSIIDNFEFTGQCVSRVNGAEPDDQYLSYFGSGISGQGLLILENLYFHGWTTTSSAGTGNNSEACTVIGGGNNGIQVLDHIVVDGSDSNPQACGWGVFPSFYHFRDSIVRFTNQGVGQWCHDIHDNIFEDMNIPNIPTHGNVIECNANSEGNAANQPANTPNVVYNNIFRHDASQYVGSGDPDLWLCPNYQPEYWFNNIMEDLGGEGWSIAGVAHYPGCPITNGVLTQSVAMFNNTLLDVPGGQPCSMDNGGTDTTLTVLNEHLINSPFGAGGCNGNGNVSNIIMSDAVGTSQGYTTGVAGSSQANQCANDTTKPCSPVSGTKSTVGAGTNKQTYCSALATYTAESAIATDAFTACKNSTTDGCSYNQTNHTMNCPAQVAVLRPVSSAWDSGAYQFLAGGNSGTGGSGVSQVCAGFLPYPCARQDLALQQESPLPMTINSDGAGLNFPAGSIYIDPDFGEQIIRVSDNNSLNGAGCFNSGTQNTILKLADNPDISSFSSDDQWFNITDTNANWWLYKFNPSTLAITCEPTTASNHQLPWHPAWLHHTSGQMIGEIAASSLTPWILQTANVSTLPGLTTSTLVDFSSTSQCGVGGNATFLSSIPQPNKSMGAYIEGPWISNDDSTYEMSVGPSQNQGWLSLLYNKTLGECAWIDTRTGQVGGNLTTTGTLSGAFPLDWGSPRAPFVPTVTQATNGSGTLTSGHTYDVCYSLVEMTREEGTGESSCSTVQRVAITGGNNALSIPSPVQCSQNGTSLSANCDIEMWNYYNVYANDEINCSNAQCPASSLFLQPAGNLGCSLGTPGANGFGSGSIVPHAAGGTNFAYAEIAFNANCVTFTQASISNAASTLDSSHFNTVTPVTVSGATLYMMVSGGIGNSSVWPSTRYGSASVDAATSTGGGSILFPGQINDSTTPPATVVDNGNLGINLFALGTIPACPGNPPSSGLLAGQCAVQSTPSTGTVNTSGTLVTWATGNHFATTWLGGMYINNVMYTISSCSSTTACTLTSSAGTQNGVTYFFGIYYVSNPVTMTALSSSGTPTAPTASTLGLYQHAAIMDRSGASISWGQEPVFGSNVLWRTGTLTDTLINVNKNNEYPTAGAYLNGVGHGLMGQTHETFDVGPSNPLGSNPGGDPNFSSICINLDSSFPAHSSALWFSPNCGSLSSITFPALDPNGSDSYDNHSTWASSAGLGTSDINTNYQQSWDVGGGASGNTFQYPTYIGRAWARELIDPTSSGIVYRYLHHRASGYLFYTLTPCVNLGGNCFNNAGLNYDTYATESQDGKYAVWLSDLTSGLGCDPTEVFVVTGFTAPNQITISANDSNSAKAPLTNQVGTVLDTTGVTGLNAQWTASSVTGSNPYTVTLTGASLSGTVSGGTWQNCTFDTSGRVNGPAAANTCGSGAQACQTGASRTDIWLGVKR